MITPPAIPLGEVLQGAVATRIFEACAAAKIPLEMSEADLTLMDACLTHAGRENYPALALICTIWPHRAAEYIRDASAATVKQAISLFITTKAAQ